MTSGDLQLCDVELINAHVTLVGEPGTGNRGSVDSGTTKPYKNSYNFVHAVNNAGVTSKVYGVAGENRVLTKTHIDHNHLNVNIVGMTQGHQFRKDVSQSGNDISLMVPTDAGIIYKQDYNWPSTPLMLENVHLQQNLRVECAFSGNWPLVKRVARFTEDWADADDGTTIKRNTDGTVRYFVGDSEGQASTAACQVPSNCIDSLKLVFKVSPRTEL